MQSVNWEELGKRFTGITLCYFLELYMMAQKREAIWSSFNRELVSNIYVGLKNDVLYLYLFIREGIRGVLLFLN